MACRREEWRPRATLLQTAVLALVLAPFLAQAHDERPHRHHRHRRHHQVSQVALQEHKGVPILVDPHRFHHEEGKRRLRARQAEEVPLHSGFAAEPHDGDLDVDSVGSHGKVWDVILLRPPTEDIPLWSDSPGSDEDIDDDDDDDDVVTMSADDGGTVQLVGAQAVAAGQADVVPPDGDVDSYCRGDAVVPAPFRRGDGVLANFEGKGFWYHGTITGVHQQSADQTFDIHYADGRRETRVPGGRLRKADGYEVMDWVDVRWKGKRRWYLAQVVGKEGGLYTVRYKADAVLEKNVQLKHLRTPRKAPPGPRLDATRDPICDVAETAREIETSIRAAEQDVRTFVERGDAGVATSRLRALGPPRHSAEVPQSPAPAPAAAPSAAAAPAPGPAAAPAAVVPAAVPGGLQAASDGSSPKDDKDLLAERSKQIQDMRKEIADRTTEIIERMKAVGALPWQLEEMNDLLKHDLDRLDHPYPTDPDKAAVEIARLQEAINDRAHRLSLLLARERKILLEKKAEPASQKDVEYIVHSVEDYEKRIVNLRAELREKMQKLKENGKLDPELEKAVKVLDRSVSKTVRSMDKVRTLEGEKPEEVQTKLVKLDKRMRRTIGEADSFGGEVLPHGKKWWRYRWEYSLVEAMVICFLCLLVAFWHQVHDVCRARFTEHVLMAPVHIEDLLPHVALATWLRSFMAEMLVLLLAVISLWLLSMFGIWDEWVSRQFEYMHSYNLPTESAMYVELSFNVAMQLVISTMLFYVLTLDICAKATRNDRDCRNLEESRLEEMRSQPISMNMIGNFATSPEEYAALKKGWLEGVTQRDSEATPRDVRTEARMVCDVLNERGVLSDGNHNAFPLWFFISMRVRKGIEKTFMLQALVWIVFAVTFSGFAFLHAFFQIAYIRISIACAAVSILGFLVMLYSIGKVRSVHDNSTVVRMKPTVAVSLFQFPLFFLCFMATRLVVSSWMWQYFFSLTLTFLITLVAFLVFFPMVIAPLIVTYLIKTSFPPHTNDCCALIRAAMDEREIMKMREELRYGRRAGPDLRDIAPASPPSLSRMI